MAVCSLQDLVNGRHAYYQTLPTPVHANTERCYLHYNWHTVALLTSITHFSHVFNLLTATQPFSKTITTKQGTWNNEYGCMKQIYLVFVSINEQRSILRTCIATVGLDTIRAHPIQ